MNIWFVVQLMVNLVFLAGFLFLLINRKQTQKDDQKFSKGLQLLQNKISVLEDLSDQTDEQVRSLTQLLEAKYREIQGLLVDSDQQIQKMEEIAKNIYAQVESSSSMMGNQSSSEVQSMNKYVKAAQMANNGKTIEEVIREIDITRGEAELIVAMNKDQLTFNQNTLPLWVQPDKAAAPQASTIGAEFLKALKSGTDSGASTDARAGVASGMNLGGGMNTGAGVNSTGAMNQPLSQQQMNQHLQQQAAHNIQMQQQLNQIQMNQAQQQAASSANAATVSAQNGQTKNAINPVTGKPEPKIRPFEFRRIDLA